MNARRAIIALVLAVVLGLAWADDPATERPEAPEPPPLPPKAKVGEQIDEPSVVISTDEEGQVIEEYFQNGRLYMVKVTPKKLPPYYLYDLDGDGIFEDLDPKSPIKPVKWKVKQW